LSENNQATRFNQNRSSQIQSGQGFAREIVHKFNHYFTYPIILPPGNNQVTRFNQNRSLQTYIQQALQREINHKLNH